MDEKNKELARARIRTVIDEESIYSKEMRNRLIENDELSYEEEGFMSGYSDMDEFEEIDRLLNGSEEYLGGEL